MKDTFPFLVQTLLQESKIKIDTDELDFQIKSHPSYPSIHAITGVLTHFNIENVALRVPIKVDTLFQLPVVFLAQIKNSQSTHFVLVNRKGANYNLIFNTKENQTVDQLTFLEQFTGIIIAVEKDDNSTEVHTKTKNYSGLFFYFAFILFLGLFFFISTDYLASIHFYLSIIGVVISALIVQHDLGISSKIVDTICSQESKTTNCDTVLNAKGAFVFNNLKLSDVSIIYFTAVSLSWFLIGLNQTSYNILFFFSLFATPAILYSIYYQIAIAKTWCMLCLGIASVLFLQAILLLFTPFSISEIPVLSFSNVLIVLSFMAIGFSWVFIASKLKKEQELNALKIESTKFKRNFELFHTLLNQSKTLRTGIPSTSEIVFGSKKAPLNITIITNPFCGHCKPVHNLVEDILKKYHDQVVIYIRFNINPCDSERDAVKITGRLLEIYHLEGEINCLKAMHDIYSDYTAEQWLEKWGDCGELNQYINVLKSESNWCKTSNINFTPEILINGKSFPKAYNRSDLIYFIEDLSDCCSTPSETLELKHSI